MELLVRICLTEPLGTKLDGSNSNILIVTLHRKDINQLITALRVTALTTLPAGSVTVVRFVGADADLMRRQLIHNHLRPLRLDPVLAGRHMFAHGAHAL
jgi:hypothetical protein